MSSEEVVENLYGCYVLVSTNPIDRGCTYIGFTVNPKRRILQHNRIRKGGARKTSKRGPWEMVLIVHGFPNQISALRFEWAWQHPKVSRRLRHLPSKKSSESKFQFCFRIVSEMLRTGPWNRLPLTIRWLKPEYEIQFKADKLPPKHMPIVYGEVKCKKIVSNSCESSTENEELNTCLKDRIMDSLCGDKAESHNLTICYLCSDKINYKRDCLECLSPTCNLCSHLDCLANLFLGGSDQIVPVTGSCPDCNQELNWGDMIRFQQGCYRTLSESQSDDCRWRDDL